MIDIITMGGSSAMLGEMTTGSQISQTFVAQAEGLRSFGIGMTTHGHRANCRLSIHLVDTTCSTLVSKVVNGANIKDNEYLIIKCGVVLRKGERYTIIVKCDRGGGGQSISLKWSPFGRFQIERFAVNSLDVQGELSCVFEYGDIEEIKEEEAAKDKPLENALPRHPRPGLVSVVIPCWNTSRIVASTLKSIYGQKYNHIEVLVVDDKSDDFKRLKKAVSKFNCQLLVNDGLKGATGARNTGWSECSGEFLFFCDSDIILESNCLSSMIQALHDNPDCSWAYCNFTVGKKKKTFYLFDPDEISRRNCSSTMSLIRASDFTGFNPLLKRLQDWDVFLTMAEKGHKGVWIDEFLFEAKDRKGITNNSIGWDEAVADLKNEHPKVWAR